MTRGITPKRIVRGARRSIGEQGGARRSIGEQGGARRSIGEQGAARSRTPAKPKPVRKAAPTLKRSSRGGRR